MLAQVFAHCFCFFSILFGMTVAFRWIKRSHDKKPENKTLAFLEKVRKAMSG